MHRRLNTSSGEIKHQRNECIRSYYNELLFQTHCSIYRSVLESSGPKRYIDKPLNELSLELTLTLINAFLTPPCKGSRFVRAVLGETNPSVLEHFLPMVSDSPSPLVPSNPLQHVAFFSAQPPHI
ncbi:hypothetical protein AVEN_89867-1 [Araneus ventricosus]|uniref:Uncharacterized protein n=1 Tax=Araneus ventricosus TaxID=182803 RepID=A0A4Y2HBS9_ARAVE|nr:hypothetical protein AVEN_89867-1 [Araneus ventricosus]